MNCEKMMARRSWIAFELQSRGVCGAENLSNDGGQSRWD